MQTMTVRKTIIVYKKYYENNNNPPFVMLLISSYISLITVYFCLPYSLLWWMKFVREWRRQISIVSWSAEGMGAANIGAFRALRTLRALRPLRAVSRWEGMKVWRATRTSFSLRFDWLRFFSKVVFWFHVMKHVQDTSFLMFLLHWLTASQSMSSEHCTAPLYWL